MIAASCGLSEIIRHRRNSPPSDEAVGGLIFDFEHVSGEIATRYISHAGKPRLAEELGEARVQAWRHGLRDRPPPMPANHPLDVSGDRNYADLESTPRTESLEDTMQRALPLWRERIEPDLRSGKTVLVVAHGNSLRGLVKHVDVCVEINR